MNLIYTICCGNEYQQIADICLPTFSDYARKIKCDLICRRGNVNRNRAIFEKLQINRYLQQYDRVAFIDLDCLISPNAPDIFESHPDDETFYVKKLALKTGFQINSGVMIVSKPHARLFSGSPNIRQLRKHWFYKYVRHHQNSYLEKWFACQLNDGEFPVQDLESKWHEVIVSNPSFIFHAWQYKNKADILKKKKNNIKITHL